MRDLLTEYLELLSSKNKLSTQNVIQKLYNKIYSQKRLKVHSLRTTREAYFLLRALSERYHPRERGAIHKTFAEALLALIALREASDVKEILAIREALSIKQEPLLVHFLNSNPTIPKKIKRMAVELTLTIVNESNYNPIHDLIPLDFLLGVIEKVAGTDKRTMVHWVSELHKWGLVEYYLKRSPNEILSFEESISIIKKITTNVINLKCLFPTRSEQVETIKKATLRSLGFSPNKHQIQDIIDAIQNDAPPLVIRNTIEELLMKNMIRHPYLFRFRFRKEITKMPRNKLDYKP